MFLVLTEPETSVTPSSSNKKGVFMSKTKVLYSVVAPIIFFLVVVVVASYFIRKKRIRDKIKEHNKGK